MGYSTLPDCIIVLWVQIPTQGSPKGFLLALPLPCNCLLTHASIYDTKGVLQTCDVTQVAKVPDKTQTEFFHSKHKRTYSCTQYQVYHVSLWFADTTIHVPRMSMCLSKNRIGFTSMKCFRSCSPTYIAARRNVLKEIMSVGKD